jgi:hypothetical protein
MMPSSSVLSATACSMPRSSIAAVPAMAPAPTATPSGEQPASVSAPSAISARPPATGAREAFERRDGIMRIGLPEGSMDRA